MESSPLSPDPLQLAELVCARVCHDLGGLAGTLAGTLQLAQEELAEEAAPGAGAEALALAREAADALARRLRLLRAALGPASDPLDAPSIADLALGLGERLRVDVVLPGPEPLAARPARLALAMLLLGAEALPVGGTLRLAASRDGTLQVAPSGPRAAWPPGTARGLAGEPPDAPRSLLAPLCGLLAQAAGYRLTADDAPPLLRAAPLRMSPD